MTRSRGTDSRHPEWPGSPREQDSHDPRYAGYDPRTGASHPNYAQNSEPPQYGDPADGYYAANQPDNSGHSDYYRGAPEGRGESADPWQRLSATAGRSQSASPQREPVEDPHAGYHYPSAQATGAYGEEHFYDQQTPPPYRPSDGRGGTNSSYAPQFDAYQQPRAGNQSGYGAEADPTQSLSGFPRPSYGHQEDERAGHPIRPELRGGNYDHADARFDLGGRRPAHDGPGHSAWPSSDPTGFGAPADPQPHMPLSHDGGQIPRYADEPLPNGQFASASFANQYHGGQYNPIAPQDNEYESEFEEDDDEEEYRGRSGRKLLIGAAFVGALAMSAGGLYAYDTLFATSSGRGGADAPVIKADGEPARVAPTDPGGRKFPHTDSGVLKKMAKRLPTAAGGRNPNDEGSTSPDGNRTKMVTTMIFDRQGRLVVKDGGQPAETARPDAPARPPPESVPSGGSDQPLPGLTIMNGNAFGQPTQANPERPSAAPTPSVEPKVVATTKAPTASVAPLRRGSTPGAPPLPTRAPGGASDTGAPPSSNQTDTAIVRPVQPVERQPPRIAAIVKTNPPVRSAPRPPAATNGYVAVLATKKSRIDALKSFADLQQKYASVLATTIPSIQVADLRARGLGKMYRAVVGPPGSRQAAQKVCSRLRASGYKSCWVKAF